MSFLRLPQPLRGVLTIYLALLLACSVFAKKVNPSGPTVGEPETGAPGITRKSADINAATAAADAAAAIHGKKHHKFPHAKLGGQVEFPEATGSTGGTGSDLPPPSFFLNPKIATPALNFTAATVNDCSGYPPDTMGVIGPSQFIIALNGRIRSFNKTNGTMDGGINADTDIFYQPVLTPGSNFTTDPRIRYDRLSQRWFIIMIDVPGQQATVPNRVMIAVSDGPNITASTVWSFFQFQAETTNFADYPTLGVDANALYIGCNIFSTSSGSFVDTSGYVVRKSSLLSGGPIVVTKFTSLTGGQSAGPYTPQGVDNLYNPSSTEGYFIGIDILSSTTIQLRRVSNPGGTPTLSGNVSINVGTFDSPFNPTVEGSTFAIDGLDERLLAAHFRNGSIWTAHNVGLNSSGNNSTHPNRDGVRWYQITNIPSGSPTPSVVQSGTVFQSGTATNLSYWMGTIMVSGQGHAALGFTIAGPNHFLDAAATGRYASDPLGTMQTPFTYTTSTSSYNPSDGGSSSDPHRWGDFSMTSLDPNDDMTMWTIQEWCAFSGNGFAVQVAKLPAPPPATPTNCNPSAVSAGASNTNIVVTGSITNASGFFDPGLAFSNHISAVVNGGGVTVNSITYTDPTHITLNVSVAGNAAGGTRTITVTNPDGQSITSSAILTINSTAATKLTIATQPSPTATAGVAFAVQPVVRIEDSLGNLITNDNSTVVTAARSAGAGTLQGTTSMTASNGLVTFTDLSHQYATNITLAFTSGSLSSTTSSVVTVNPAAFSQLQILVPGQTATPTVSPGRAGTPTAHVSGTSFNVTVNAVDAFWNFVNTGTDNVALSSSDNIAVLPPNTALVAGTVTLPVTLKKVGTQSIATSDVTNPGINIDVAAGISVTPATLTVVASNASRVYGQTNPTFGGTLTGVEVGDNITASFNSPATTNSSKGTYSIVPSLNDPNDRLGNYTVLSTNGTLTITAAPLSVTASNANRLYGQTNPVFSGTLVGVQNNDNITATFSSVATTNSSVGNYPISATLSDPTSKLSNYTVTTNNGVLNVTSAPLTVTADDAFRVWGAPNPAPLTGSIFGIQNNDNITASYSTTATTNSDVGPYPITFTLTDPGAKLPNYIVTTNNGTLTVSDSPPVISPAIQDQFAAVGSTVSLTVAASDSDNASGQYQTLTFTLDPGAPSGATIDPTTGTFTWTPPPGTEGTTNPVTVRVTDNAVPSQSTTGTFNIIVISRPTLLALNHNNDGSISIQWSTAPGILYRSQFKNALTDASWTDLSQFTANSSVSDVSDTPTQARYYRLSAGFSASDPAGEIPLTLLGSSDSYISIPFTRPIADQQTIMSVSSNVVTVSNATWSPGQFVYVAGVQSNTYYARFDSGALEGRAYNIISNDANTLTLNLGSDALDNAAAGDLLSIIPYWTLASAFPNGDGIFASPAPGNRFTEILSPDDTSTGINLSSTKIYFFNSGIWKQVGQGSVNFGDDILALNSYFIVRQNVASNSTMMALGAVVLPKLSVTLRTDAAVSQDNSLGLTRASVVTLNDSGLISSSAFAPSPLPGSRTDELLTFDNATVAKNKSSSAIYYYWSNAWRRVGFGSTDVGTDQVFTPGSGFIIRKATNATSAVWTNAP